MYQRAPKINARLSINIIKCSLSNSLSLPLSLSFKVQSSLHSRSRPKKIFQCIGWARRNVCVNARARQRERERDREVATAASVKISERNEGFWHARHLTKQNAYVWAYTYNNKPREKSKLLEILRKLAKLYSVNHVRLVPTAFWIVFADFNELRVALSINIIRVSKREFQRRSLI